MNSSSSTDIPENDQTRRAEAADCVEIIREESRETGNTKRGWLTFWRRPSKRDRQIAALQTGYAEMIGLMRTIRTNLEKQTENQTVLYHHLPDAISGLKAVGEHAQQQTQLLKMMHTQQAASLEHDKKIAGSMDRFNDTLTVMDSTNQQAANMISELAERTQEAEDLVRSMLIRSQRRLMFMVIILLLTTLSVTGAAVYLITMQ